MGEIKKERRMATKRMVQEREAIEEREKEATKRRAAKGTGQGITRKREKAARKMAKKVIRKIRIQTQTRKKGRSGKDLKLLPEFLYNQLWCFDLAMEQALERCVEDKLQ